MEVDGTPDLTDFMNDWFFGTVGVKHNAVAAGSPAYDLTGESSSSSKKKQSSEKKPQRAESEGGRSGGGGSSRGSNASKQTQEWLEEAKRMMVGSGSPGRMGSPSRQVPKFAGGNGTEPSPALDRRDPMSRSARRCELDRGGDMLRVDAVEQGGRPGGGGAGGEHAPEQDGGVQAGGLAPLPRRGRRLGPALRRRVMLDHNEHSFVEFLKNTYRKSSTDGAGDSPPEQKNSVSGASQDAKKSNSGRPPIKSNACKSAKFVWFYLDSERKKSQLSLLETIKHSF
uniref:Uncharacterized protein n=1 Tax=Aegilops tauschii TaxID=37682 RepID=R7WFQ1_AEGTA